MRRYLEIYWMMMRNSLIREMSFKANFILWMFVELLWFVGQIVFIKVLFSYTQSIGGWSHNAQRRYSSAVDFPVPRPPIRQLNWVLKSRSIGPMNLLLDTWRDSIIREGVSGSACRIRVSFAKHA